MVTAICSGGVGRKHGDVRAAAFLPPGLLAWPWLSHPGSSLPSPLLSLWPLRSLTCGSFLGSGDWELQPVKDIRGEFPEQVRCVPRKEDMDARYSVLFFFLIFF